MKPGCENFPVAANYYVGVDQGTTGTTALILDGRGKVCAVAHHRHTQHYPRPGWVEHDPEELWEKTLKTIASALEAARLRPSDITALGLANQGETCLVWDKKTGRPIYNAIVWQDRRTAEDADRLRADHGEAITQKTGAPVDAYFSGLKIRWILDHVPRARSRAERGELLAGTLDTYLLWKLSGGRLYVTDPSTASRTMLFNIHAGRWDQDLAAWLDVPPSLLASLSDSAGLLGHTAPDGPLGVRIAITASLVDQPAALFGQACFRPGSVKTTYGTGCFMLMNTGPAPVRSPNGLLTTVAWGLKGRLTYALDGGVYIAGAAVEWLRHGLGLIRSADESEGLACSVPDTGGVYFVPAFTGLAAPYWDQYARGMIIGITGGTSRAHIARATLEAIAFQVRENLDVMRQDSAVPIERMRADGGGAANQFLMQFQADMLGIPVDVPQICETTALGAAWLAALGAGDFDDPAQFSPLWRLRRCYEPQISADQREALLAKWKQAVLRCRQWAAP